MIDSHCHLEQDPTFFDLEQVISDSRKQLRSVITVCARPEDLKKTAMLVSKHPEFINACFGLHPYEATKHSEKEIEQYLEQIKENRQIAKAIGEIGLDFFLVKDPESQKRCRDIFIQFIEFSKELGLPLVIHCRDAYHETIDLLSNNDAKKVVFHYFGAKDFTKEIMEYGWYLSIPVTIATAKKLKDILAVAEDDKILAETDSPIKLSVGRMIFPADVRIVIENIAKEKKKSFEETEMAVDKNTIDFFSLKL